MIILTSMTLMTSMTIMTNLTILTIKYSSSRKHKHKNHFNQWAPWSTFATETKGRMYKVKFNFEQKGLEPVEFTNVEPGLSLLEIALMNDLELHHNCGGVCACTTCHVYIQNGMDYIEELSDKEEDFIDRAVNPRLNSRLGCQSILLEGDGEVEATIPDQTQFLGE